MLRPVSQAQRRALLLWSASLCTGALLLTPLAARSSGDVARDGTISAQRLAVPEWDRKQVAAEVTLSRDPFSADAVSPPDADRMPEAQGQGPTGVGQRVVANTPIAGTRSRISAVILGNTAQALVIDAAGTRIVEAGSSIDGLRIVEITTAGVRLSNGELRKVGEGSSF